MRDSLGEALAAVVEGDIDCFPIVAAANHEALLKAAAKLPSLVVSRSSLIHVLTTWRSSRHVAGNIQLWASFVRRGWAAGNFTGPIKPVKIQYDEADEQLIADIIGRLDEIGDAVDGVVDEAEHLKMLRALQD